MVPRPEWPPLKAFRAQPVAEATCSSPASSSPSGRPTWSASSAGSRCGPRRRRAGGLVVDDGSGPDVPIEERDVPPDVLLATAPRPFRSTTSPAGAPLAARHVVGIGALDERVLNPIGFEADVDGPEVELTSLTGDPTEALVRSLGRRGGCGARSNARKTSHWSPASRWPASRSRCARSTRRSPGGSGPEFVEALTAPVDLDDAVAREEHSVVLRRAALGPSRRRPGGDGWRRGRRTRGGGADGQRRARHQAAGDVGVRAAAGGQAARRRPAAGPGPARFLARRREVRALRVPRSPRDSCWRRRRSRCRSATCWLVPPPPPTATWC